MTRRKERKSALLGRSDGCISKGAQGAKKMEIWMVAPEDGKLAIAIVG